MTAGSERGIVRASPRSVSVVVPLRNGAATLAAQLDALAAQDYRGSWELILVDNGSTDGSRERAADRLAALPAARVVDASGRVGAAHARNAGAAAARGDFLAFCDADDLASRRWLRELVGAARRGDLVAGRLEVEELNDPLCRAWHDAPPSDRPLRGHGFLPFASGGNCGVWRDVFDALGGFDEERVAGEDIDLAWRARLHGYRLCFAREAVVHQRFQRRLGGVAKQHFRWGRANARLFRDFRAAGMPRPSLRRALLAWGWVIAGGPALVWSPTSRGRWVRHAALRAGQAVGSLRERVLFL